MSAIAKPDGDLTKRIFMADIPCSPKEWSSPKKRTADPEFNGEISAIAWPRAVARKY
jgi:hypothetical protein